MIIKNGLVYLYGLYWWIYLSDDLSTPKCLPKCVCLSCYIKLFFTPNLYIIFYISIAMLWSDGFPF